MRSRILKSAAQDRVSKEGSILAGSVHKSRRSLAKAVKCLQPAVAARAETRLNGRLESAQFNVENQLVMNKVETAAIPISAIRNNLHLLKQSNEKYVDHERKQEFKQVLTELYDKKASGRSSAQRLRRRAHPESPTGGKGPRLSKFLRKKVAGKASVEETGPDSQHYEYIGVH